MQPNILKDFRESDEGKTWHRATEQTWFHEGIKAALLTFPQPLTPDAAAAAANYYRLEGARAMASHLCTITEPPAQKSLDKRSNLIHTK